MRAPATPVPDDGFMFAFALLRAVFVYPFVFKIDLMLSDDNARLFSTKEND